MLGVLEREIERTQKGIHVSEVVGLLEASIGGEIGSADPLLILSLAQHSGRFRRDWGDYIYPADWANAKRLRPSEACLQVLEQAGPQGLETSALIERVSVLMGREIPKTKIHNPLDNIGAKYDEETRRWQLLQTESSVDAKEPDSEALRTDGPILFEVQERTPPPPPPPFYS